MVYVECVLTCAQKGSTVRPVHVDVTDPFYSPFVLDTLADHWLFGNYDFKVAEVNNGMIIINSRHALRKGKDGLVPSHQTFRIHEDDGLVMCHLIVYKAALMIRDETLGMSAIGKFRVALYQVKSARVLVNLVKQAFRAEFCNLDTDYVVRNLIVNHACLWDNVWTEEGCLEYLVLFEEVPEFARMLKEMEHQAYAEKSTTLP